MSSAATVTDLATAFETAIDRAREDGYTRGYQDAMADARARVVRMEFYQAHKEKEGLR